MSHICISGHGVHCTKCPCSECERPLERGRTRSSMPLSFILLTCSGTRPNKHTHIVYRNIHTHVYTLLYKYTGNLRNTRSHTHSHDSVSRIKSLCKYQNTHTGQTTSGTPCKDFQGQHATTLYDLAALLRKHTFLMHMKDKHLRLFSQMAHACKVDIKKLTFLPSLTIWTIYT